MVDKQETAQAELTVLGGMVSKALQKAPTPMFGTTPAVRGRFFAILGEANWADRREDRLHLLRLITGDKTIDSTNHVAESVIIVFCNWLAPPPNFFVDHKRVQALWSLFYGHASMPGQTPQQQDRPMLPGIDLTPEIPPSEETQPQDHGKDKNMTKDSFADAQFPEEHGHTGLSSFPFIQWVNGNKAFKKLHPVLGSGGWAMPTANVLGELDWERGELPHKTGETTEVYFADSLRFALLAEKFRWFTRVGGRLVWLTGYEVGARGKYQVAVMVKGAEAVQSTPWMLTATGMSGKALYEAVKAYRNKILPAASSIAKRAMPLYSFWLEVNAGEPRQVGVEPNTSIITPPSLVLPDNLSDRKTLRQYLIEAYVGQGLLSKAGGWFDEAQRWAKAKFRLADGRGVTEHGEILDDGLGAYTGPPPPEEPPGMMEAEDIPF